MAISPRLELRVGQSLVMTPQLLQAIKLLQYNNVELAAFIEQELERNPLLERAEAEEDGDAPRREAAADGDLVDTAGSGDVGNIAEAIDADRDDVFEPEGPSVSPQPDPGGGALWDGVGRGGFADGEVNLEDFATAETSLAAHLEAQIGFLTDATDRLIAQHLIGLLDEAGYLREPLPDIAERLGVEQARIAALLARLQELEPCGVFARDLAECLALQLAERDRLDPMMRTLIGNLELLAKRDFAQLRKLCRCDDEDLAGMVAEIRSLDPRPGSAFGGGTSQTIAPDVIVREGADGGWRIDLVSEQLPRLLINRSYYAAVGNSAEGAKARTFLNECMQDASWLMKSLDQRARTILKVATEIVRQQDAFFAYGVQHLKPLNLRQVAERIDMHESTVSRVTSNKYMATPRGIFELKYFFTTAIAATGNGEAHSAEAVRHRIREMIDAEAPDNVLSDDAIVVKLRESGIDLARRTVAKYRESLNIPSSVQRRREKTAAL
ncbi:MAG: RNA polymerase factor sigma-54 [Flavobacteriaceae bacterium]